jgi:hypothetical protein
VGVIMGHFENGRYVEEPTMIDQLFGFKLDKSYEDPHTKAIKLILEHINTQNLRVEPLRNS